MVENARQPINPLPRRRFDTREFSRVATWGLAALGALTIAVYAASSEIGENRLIMAVAQLRGVPPPARLARKPEDDPTRQLASAIRELSADREQLVARLDTLERTLGDVTGSIAKLATVHPAPVPAWATPAPFAPPPVVSTPDAIPAIAAPVTQDVPVPRPAPAAPATGEAPAAAPKTEVSPKPEAPPKMELSLRTTAAPKADAAPKPDVTPKPEVAARAEFGVDLGRAPSVEGLRQLWIATRNKHGGALEGLRPLVAVREIPRTAGVELRLVAGPLPNAAAAARVCAQLAGAPCHPTVFDGQRLALR